MAKTGARLQMGRCTLSVPRLSLSTDFVRVPGTPWTWYACVRHAAHPATQKALMNAACPDQRPRSLQRGVEQTPPHPALSRSFAFAEPEEDGKEQRRPEDEIADREKGGPPPLFCFACCSSRKVPRTPHDLAKSLIEASSKRSVLNFFGVGRNWSGCKTRTPPSLSALSRSRGKSTQTPPWPNSAFAGLRHAFGLNELTVLEVDRDELSSCRICLPQALEKPLEIQALRWSSD